MLRDWDVLRFSRISQRWIFCLWFFVVGYAACSQQPQSTQESVTEVGIESMPELVPEEAGANQENVSGDEASTDASNPADAEATPERGEEIQESFSDRSNESLPESVVELAEKVSPVSKNLDSTGGRVCHEHVCVEISTQAMDQRTLVVVFQPPNQVVPPGSVAPPMDVGPDNWKPKGSMFVVFRNTQVPPGIKPEQLRVAFVENNRWQFVQTTYDSQQKEWKGETTHFSVWGLVVQGKSCQSHNDCHDAEQCNQGTCQAPACQTDQNCQTNEYCSQNLKVCFKAPPCRSKPEICNSLDDNCNGIPDEGCTFCRTSQECAADHVCLRGVCTSPCLPDQIFCAGQCVSVFLDVKNCGACGIVCKNTEQCVLGSCVP
jgi:hypothetical protein